MATEQEIQQIKELINGILEAEPSYYLVEVRIKPTNNIKVFLDGDNGLTIEKCVQINRKLYALIDEKGWYPGGEFSLEVSSPGVDEPLKVRRQFLKNANRKVEVIFLDGSRREGKLLSSTENDLLLEETTGKGKKAVTQQIVIPFQQIKTTTVQIQF